MKNRSVVALLVAVGALVAADIIVHVASSAQAQPPGLSSQVAVSRSVTGITGTIFGTAVRCWSDGVVEERDIQETGQPRWIGWRRLMP